MAEPMNKKQKLDYLVTEFAGLKRSVAKLLKRQEAMETTLAKIASGNSDGQARAMSGGCGFTAQPPLTRGQTAGACPFGRSACAHD
jgi:hypothetical protein